MDHIIYTKNVLWLKPFVEVTGGLVPLNKLKRIMGYRVKSSLRPITDAALTKYSKEKQYRMSLKMYDYHRKQKMYKRVRCETILINLAHELAHLVYWEHDPDHFALQAKIMIKFKPILEKYGIKDHLMPNPEKLIGVQ